MAVSPVGKVTEEGKGRREEMGRGTQRTPTVGVLGALQLRRRESDVGWTLYSSIPPHTLCPRSPWRLSLRSSHTGLGSYETGDIGAVEEQTPRGRTPRPTTQCTYRLARTPRVTSMRKTTLYHPASVPPSILVQGGPYSRIIPTSVKRPPTDTRFTTRSLPSSVSTTLYRRPGGQE